MWIRLKLHGVKQTSGLVQRYGTKPAGLVEFIKNTIAMEKSKEPARFIVFSQVEIFVWHDTCMEGWQME